MGPRDICLLHRYCERLQMVAHAGRHYGELFRRESGITLGGQLLLAIFNVVVYVLVLHWDSLVEEWAEVVSSDDNGHMAQPSGRKIWEMDDCRRQEE